MLIYKYTLALLILCVVLHIDMTKRTRGGQKITQIPDSFMRSETFCGCIFRQKKKKRNVGKTSRFRPILIAQEAVSDARPLLQMKCTTAYDIYIYSFLLLNLCNFSDWNKA